ncbi:MAG: RnfABCDGE type electron transport complex subunit D [Bacilli bacterium]|nr:RnfABCDGE type electron transport complex subunit D [Bacilli bacterium]
MVEYIVNSGTYIKDNDNLLKIRLRMLIALMPFLLAKFYYINFANNFLNLIIIFICFSSISFMINYIKKDKIKVTSNLITSLIDSIIVTIILSHNIPVYVLFISSILGYSISKFQMNKLKKFTISGPILCGGIAALLIKLFNIKTTVGLINNNYVYFGLFLVLLAFLIITKTVKWKIPVVFIFTFLSINYMVMGYNDLNISFIASKVFACNLLFYALVASFNLNSPITPIGQILYGLFLGILTSILIYCINPVYACVFGILIINFFINVLDKVGSVSRFDFSKSIWLFTSAWLAILVVGLSICMFKNIDEKKFKNDKQINHEEKTNTEKVKEKIIKPEEKTEPIDNNQNQVLDGFEIKEKEVSNNIATYLINYKEGNTSARIVINNGMFKSFVILEHNEKISEQDSNQFISKLLFDQKTVLESEDNNYTNNTLKSIANKVLQDYNGGN